MIRAVCTATLLFFDPNDKAKAQVLAPMLQIVELPDWVAETTTFRVNVKCGRIKVMNDKTATKAIETVQEEAQDLAPVLQEEKLTKAISKMNKTELKAYCEAHKIEYKADATNPELIALINNSNVQ